MTKLGAIFPQTEIGNDTGAIREYAQATESLGFDFLLAFDHVLGANAETHTDLTGPYRHYDAFHEPFVLFGYLAAVTNSVLSSALTWIANGVANASAGLGWLGGSGSRLKKSGLAESLAVAMRVIWFRNARFSSSDSP